MRSATALIALVMVATACGGESSSAPAPTSSVTTTSPAATTTESPAATGATEPAVAATLPPTTLPPRTTGPPTPPAGEGEFATFGPAPDGVNWLQVSIRGGSSLDEPMAPLSESKVRWAGFGGMAELLFFVAQDGGFFEDQGLEVERIELGGGVDLFTALASGSVAFTQLGTQHGIRSVTNGLDFRGIYGFSHGSNEFGVISPEAAAAKGITQDSTIDEKFEALRGLKIGTGRPGSTTTTLAIGAMEQRGIDTTADVELFPLGSGGALLPAFQAREIDAFFWIPPETQIAAAEAGAVTIDFRVLDELAGVNWASYFTTDNYILEHPDTVQAFLRAVLLAREWALANQAEALELARARFPDLDEAPLVASFQIDYDSLKPSILFSDDGFEKGRYILNLGLPVDEPNTTLLSAVVTNELVIAAAIELGIAIE